MNLVTSPKPPSQWETFRNADGRVPTVAEYDARFPPPAAPAPAEEKVTRVTMVNGEPVHRASIELEPTPKQIEAFMARLTRIGDCLIFNAHKTRHMPCRLADGTVTLISAARFYWRVRYPQQPFSAEDVLINACGCASQDGRGEGLCVTHLRLERRERRKRES